MSDFPISPEIFRPIITATPEARARECAGSHYPFLTSKERDSESKLDYFLARYYSSTHGRFTSPDEFSGGPRELYVLGSGDGEKQALPYAEILNPQSINKLMDYYNRIWKSQNFQDGMIPGSGDGETRPKHQQNGPLDFDVNRFTLNFTKQTGQGLQILADIEMTLFDPTGVVTVSTAVHTGDGVHVVFGLLGMVTKYGKRSIVMEVTGATDKSITQIRKQLEKGLDYMISQDAKNIELHVLVTTKEMAKKIKDELSRLRNRDVIVTISQ